MTPLYAAIDMQHQEPMINRPLPKPSGRLRAARRREACSSTSGANANASAEDAAADAAAQRRRRLSSARVRPR